MVVETLEERLVGDSVVIEIGEWKISKACDVYASIVLLCPLLIGRNIAYDCKRLVFSFREFIIPTISAT